MLDSETLARGERLHAEAVAEHETARAKQKEIDERLKGVSAKMHDITQRRVSGQSTDAETAEFAALHADAELLRKMLADAKNVTALAADKIHAVVIAHDDARQAFDRQQAEMEFNALLATTREIETVFCKALRAVALAGKKVGHHTLSQSFQKSDALHRALDLGVIPPEQVAD